MVAPLLLSSCMMLGSGGMGHGSGGSGHGDARAMSMSGQALIKEVVLDGVRITAEFPPYSLGDDLAYRVTLRRERDSTAIVDASVVMLIGADATRDRFTRVSPSTRDNGVYVFRPAVVAEGAYAIVIRVERVGNITLTPGAQLEQVVRVDARMDMSPREENGRGSFRLAPMALLGAGVMAVMMLLALR